MCIWDKAYDSVEEERRRFIVFLRNVHFIEQHNTRHNDGLESHEVEINHLADLVNLKKKTVFLYFGTGKKLLNKHAVVIDKLDYVNSYNSRY